jgi:hypothetical protein
LFGLVCDLLQCVCGHLVEAHLALYCVTHGYNVIRV